jgi:signal peptidase II
MRLGLAVAGVVWLADRLSKVWLMDLLAAHPGGIRLTPFFNLVMVWNPGVSFGLFGSESAWGPWLLTGVAAVIVVGLLVWLRRAEGRWLPMALGLVIGGAVGNIVDRVMWGKVADFLDFHAAGYHWPAFNVADSAIVVGVAILIGESLWSGRDKR